MRINRAYLYENAQINYKNIQLTAARIEMDFKKQEVSAFPEYDSLGQEVGVPHFDDQKQVFDAKEMVYNFQTQKARIKNVITKENEMFVHGDVVKKLPDDVAFIKRARFTTCDLEHPHFNIVALRAKIIPGDKVVTGGAMLFLNGVPTPLALPFALFPNTEKHKSGIIIPAYGESQSQGFFLREGGFYWSINDYLDWRITGDIYTRGEWNIRNSVQYVKRYKYSGSFNLTNGMVPSGEKDTPGYGQTRSIRLGWTHAQDPKANQNSTFTANVNYFNSASQQYSTAIADHFNTTSNSNIAYQVRIANRFNISTTANMDYNMTTGNINATLPSLNFSMNPIYPFQPKVRKGAQKWYESFKINYSMNANNQATGHDSIFWTNKIFEDMRSGVKHNIPMEMNIKLFKGKLNWGHSLRYTEQWHFKASRKGLDTVITPQYNASNEFVKNDTSISVAVLDREYGFFSTRDFGYSTSLSTTLYGLLQFKRGLFRAFRHVMTPSVSFSLSPDFVTPEGFGHMSGYRYYEDRNGEMQRYNLYDGSPAGFSAQQRSGSIGFSLGNNLEMKIRDRKDTVTGTRKVKLIQSLSLSTSYNLAADSLNWAPISVSATIPLVKNLQLNFRSSFSLYAKDSVTTNNTTRYYTVNRYIWETDKKFLLRENTSVNTSLSWQFGSKEKSADDEKTSVLTSQNTEIFGQPSAFDVKWSLSFSYNIGYNSNYDPRYYNLNIWGYPITTDPYYSEYSHRITQNFSFNGNLQLTSKWNITFNSGFDFLTKKMAQTSFNISRDLHCWDLSFTWSPFGMYKEWSFNIRLKPGMLSDVLKYDKKKSFRDDESYR
jgi:hypothetical protein